MKNLIQIFLWINLISLVNSQESLEYDLNEESPIGSFVGNLVEDASLEKLYEKDEIPTLKYRFLEDSGNDNVFLSVDEESGLIRVSKVFDRDVLCPNKAKCSFQQDSAVVHPQGRLKVITIHVNVIDINDNIPYFQRPIFNLEIPESANPGAAFSLPLASDPDSPEFSISQYRVASNSDAFDIEETILNGQPRSVQLILQENLDREIRSNYKLVLAAFDGGAPPNSGSIDINITVLDANDHGPIFDNKSYAIAIPEDTPIETVFIKVQATDLDAGLNGQVFYSFGSATDASALSMFDINKSTGGIFLQERLNYEKASSFHVVIAAKDGGVYTQPDYATLTIDIIDTNDNPPQISVNTITGKTKAEIYENIEEGRFVAHISAKDPDGGDGGLFDCNIRDPHFKLKPLPGSRYEVLTAQSFDRETISEYVLSLSCTDKGNPPLSSKISIPIDILDMNDNSPEFTQDLYEKSIYENNVWNDIFLKVTAEDKDEGRNADLIYSLQNDKDLFTIDKNTGVIRANTIFDYESQKQISFQVTVTDKGLVPKAASCDVTIAIIDENDQKPIFSESVYFFSIAENQKIGVSVGTVSATDYDSPPYNTVKYSLMKTTNDFVIGKDSGIILTNTYLDREKNFRYILHVVATNTDDKITQMSTATVEVSLLDENDNEPVLDFPNESDFTLNVSNLVPIGAEIGKIQAHDLDSNEKNNELSYFFIEGNFGNMFDLEEETGKITTRISLQQYTFHLFEMLISVQDNGIPMRTTFQRLNIQVNSSLPYLPYNGSSSRLVTVNNVIIVICVAAISGFIILILVVIIICLKIRDKNLKHRQNAENQNQLVISLQREAPDGRKASDEDHDFKEYDKFDGKNNLNYNNISYNSGNYGEYVDFKPKKIDNSFNENCYTTVYPKNIQVNSLCGSNKCSPMINRKNGIISNDSLVSAPLSHHTYSNIINNPIAQMQSPQLKPANGYLHGNDADSDSVLSGELSNADSGVGHSEEGDAKKISPLFNNDKILGRIPNQHDMRTRSVPQNLNKSDSKPYPHNVSTNSLTKPRKTSHQYVPGSNISFRPLTPQNNNSQYSIRFPQNRSGHILRPAGSFETLPEDDDRSSTSGSYIVDVSDLNTDFRSLNPPVDV